MKKSYKILIGCLVGGFILIQVNHFFNPPPSEYTCYTDFKFHLDLQDYSKMSFVDENIKKELSDEFSLPRIYTYGSTFPASDQTSIYTLRITGEYSENSPMIDAIKGILETMPEVSQLTGPSIWCPPK